MVTFCATREVTRCFGTRDFVWVLDVWARKIKFCSPMLLVLLWGLCRGAVGYVVSRGMGDMVLAGATGAMLLFLWTGVVLCILFMFIPSFVYPLACLLHVL